MTLNTMFNVSIGAVCVIAAAITAAATWWLVRKYYKKYPPKVQTPSPDAEENDEPIKEKISIQELLIPIGAVVAIVSLVIFSSSGITFNWIWFSILVGLILIGILHFNSNSPANGPFAETAKKILLKKPVWITGSIIIIGIAIWIWKPWEQWHWSTRSINSTVAIGKPWPNQSTIQPAVQREVVGTRQSDPVVILWDNEKAGYDTHWMMNHDMVPGQWHPYWKANVQRYWQAVHREDYDAKIYVKDCDTKDTVGIITFDPTDGTPHYNRTPKFTNHSGEYAWTTSKLMDVMLTVCHDE